MRQTWISKGLARVDHLIDYRTVDWQKRETPCGPAVELVLEAIGDLLRGYRLLAPGSGSSCLECRRRSPTRREECSACCPCSRSTPWLQFNPLSLMNANGEVFGVSGRPAVLLAHPAYRALAARRPHVARSGPPKEAMAVLSDRGPRRLRHRDRLVDRSAEGGDAQPH